MKEVEIGQLVRIKDIAFERLKVAVKEANGTKEVSNIQRVHSSMQGEDKYFQVPAIYQSLICIQIDIGVRLDGMKDTFVPAYFKLEDLSELSSIKDFGDLV